MIFYFFYFLLCLTSSNVIKKLTKIQDVRNHLIVLYYFVSWILQSSTFFKECVLRAKRASPRPTFIGMDIYIGPTFPENFCPNFFWQKYCSKVPYLPAVWTYVWTFVVFLGPFPNQVLYTYRLYKEYSYSLRSNQKKKNSRTKMWCKISHICVSQNLITWIV